MARKDSKNVVYVIGAANSSRVKIGTTQELGRRLADIQRMSPDSLEVLWQTPGGYRLESALHKHFADRRVHGEWFDFAGDSPAKRVEEAVNEIGYATRLIGKWMQADTWEGDFEEGALRFARGLAYLHRGLDQNMANEPLVGSDIDRGGEILAFSLHYLACFFGILSAAVESDGDEERAAGWIAAADAVGRAQQAVVEAVSSDYVWGSLPDFVGRDRNQPFTTWGCRLHWTVGNAAGGLPCQCLHEGEDIPGTFGSFPEFW